MNSRVKAARAFLAGMVALPLGAALLRADLGGFVEDFHERRVEEQVLSVWRRRASPVDYQGCVSQGIECEGKIVFWHVWSHSGGSWAGTQSQKVRFTNPKQVPGSYWSSGGYDAVAMVSHVKPDLVELVFIGTPSGPYGGTTWTKKFGYEGK